MMTICSLPRLTNSATAAFGPGQRLSQKPKRFFASFIRAKVIHALEVDGIYFSDRYKFLEVDASVRFRFQRVKLLLRELDIFSFGVFKAPDQTVALDCLIADGAPELISHPAAALVREQVKTNRLILDGPV